MGRPSNEGMSDNKRESREGERKKGTKDLYDWDKVKIGKSGTIYEKAWRWRNEKMKGEVMGKGGGKYSQDKDGLAVE